MNGSQESLMCGDAPIVNPIILTEKKCTKCGIVQKIDEYVKRVFLNGRAGWRSECRTCFNIKRRGRTFSDLSIFKGYNKNAIRKGIAFDIKLQQFIAFFNKPCIYCGDTARGIDRIDNSKGYIAGNMATCCKRCNQMKSNLSQQEFIDQCIKVSKKMT
jgi:hypothetical protein